MVRDLAGARSTAAMVTSSLTVVLNSMRLREKDGRAVQMILDMLIPWRETTHS